MAERQSTLMPTSTAISSSSTKHVFLHEWWLVNVKRKGGSSDGLAVGGFAHRDAQRVSLFCSAPISKRLDATTVLARDGIAVSLNGLINSRHTTNNGYSMEVCSKFMVGFPYDWDDYATYHAHQRCGGHADVSDKSKRYSSTEKNVTNQSNLEDVPVTSMRNIPKRDDLKNLMDDILAKARSPKENKQPQAKFVAKRCLKASPIIDVAGYNHDQVRNAEVDMMTTSEKEQNSRLQWKKAVCSPNRAAIYKKSAKRCLKASPGEDETRYNQAVNPHGRTGVSTRSMTRLKKCND